VSLASSVANAPTFAETIIETDATVAITVNMGPDSGLFVVEEVRDGGDTITINGQAGNDTITVGLPDSPINAELALNGGDGNDTIIGSDGAEVISGGNGDDSLSGGGGDDTLLGGEGRDRLMGGAGDDELSGGGGDDTLFGDTGEAIPLAEGGDDTLNGGLGVDILNGETGADRVNGNEGNDILRIQGSAAVDDTLDGGAGADVLELIGDVLVPVVLGEFGGASTKTVSLERIVAGGRVLAGTDVDNRFDFSKITFVSLAAIHGLGGNDTIIGSLGSDLIYGHSPDSTSTDSDDDTLRGSGGNDTLFGGPGDDVLKGGLGNDLLNGGVGEDNIDGELGNDTLQARQDEAEFDTLQGGGGIDSLVNLDTEALVLNGFDGKTYGIESIRGNGQAIVGNDDANTFDFRFVGTAAVTLTSVTEIRGGAGDDTIYGGAATDSIFGDDGMDELFGGAGNDALFGGDGDDIIKGDGGVDTIDGGVGADLLYGGDGNDIFVFNSGDNDDLAIDKVMDYRNDLLRYVGYASTGFSSGYAAIRSESIDGGVRVVQNVSGKKVDLRGPLRVKPVASRFVFVTGTP
jgi:Ca2+-binding RTX toxin-like protein